MRMSELDPNSAVAWRGLELAYGQLGDAAQLEVVREELTGLQAAEEARYSRRWLIPQRYRTAVIFGILLIAFAIALVSLKFVWSIARQGWSNVNV